MKLKTLFVLAFTLLLPLMAYSKIDLVLKYSQLPDMAGYDWSSETAVGSKVADDWLCEDGIPIVAIKWWGSYYTPGQYPYPNSDSWPDPSQTQTPDFLLGFNIEIYGNVPAGSDPNMPWGHPGDLILAQFVPIANVSEVLFGVATKPGGAQENVWEYYAYLPETFNQEQGETYWLVIQSVHNSTSEQWGWHQTDKELYGNLEDAVQKGYSESECVPWELLYNTEMAFELYGIPEPSTLGLLGMALAGMGFVIRRRK